MFSKLILYRLIDISFGRSETSKYSRLLRLGKERANNNTRHNSSLELRPHNEHYRWLVSY